MNLIVLLNTNTTFAMSMKNICSYIIDLEYSLKQGDVRLITNTKDCCFLSFDWHTISSV